MPLELLRPEIVGSSIGATCYVQQRRQEPQNRSPDDQDQSKLTELLEIICLFVPATYLQKCSKGILSGIGTDLRFLNTSFAGVANMLARLCSNFERTLQPTQSQSMPNFYFPQNMPHYSSPSTSFQQLMPPGGERRSPGE